MTWDRPLQRERRVQRWEPHDHDEPVKQTAGSPIPAFLPRPKPAEVGVFPRMPWAQRIYRTFPLFDVAISSTAPNSDGNSVYLIVTRGGEWVSYVHNRHTGTRRRIGNSAYAVSLAQLFGVL